MNNNFSSLLIALLIFVIGIPIASDLDLISLQMSRVLGASSLLAVGVWSLRGAGRLYSAGMLAAITGIVLVILSIVRDSDMLHVIALLAMFVFLLLATINAFRQIAVGNDISPNRIVGAVCVYLLLGVMWSIAYNVLEYLQPDSFKGLTELVSPAWNPDWIYFSFVTITTLGYGDITPLTQTARSLTVAEAIVGQFYIAVLVAGLVSAYISSKRDSNDRD
jgi:cbb3-type cytochrome oxidase subunit 3